MNRYDIKSLLATPFLNPMRVALRDAEKLDTLQREINWAVKLHERRARVRRGK